MSLPTFKNFQIRRNLNEYTCSIFPDFIVSLKIELIEIFTNIEDLKNTYNPNRCTDSLKYKSQTD